MDLMRQIDVEIKSEWDKIRNSFPSITLVEDCEPNMLIGWTDRNPSIWDVTENSGKPSLENILVALCRRRKDWEKVAYIKFKKSAVDSAKLSLTKTNGNTSDSRIDLSNTHFQIEGVTAKQLCTLIYYIIKDKFETGIFKKSDYNKILLDAYDRTQISELQEGSTAYSSETLVTEASTIKNMEQDTNKIRIDDKRVSQSITSSGTQ